MKRQRRKSNGTFLVVTASLAVFVLLPLALISFELSRLVLAQKQLRVATDSAALAAALAYRSSVSEDASAALAEAHDAGISFFKRNSVSGHPLSDALPDSRVDTDTPAANQALFDVTYDSNKNVFTAKAAYGLQPAFAGIFGNSVLAIHANSKAGAGAGSRDIVIVLDISGSMGEPTSFNHRQVSSLNAAVASLKDFVRKMKTEDAVHFGLVTYSGSGDGSMNPHSIEIERVVELSQSSTRDNEMLNALDGLHAREWTATGPAMRTGIDMLNGSGHRRGAEPVLLLITDGLPNTDYNNRQHGQFGDAQTRNECIEQALHWCAVTPTATFIRRTTRRCLRRGSSASAFSIRIRRSAILADSCCAI
jgi:Flp pilus assembly protein TadG/uncharacterized protein YegL